MKPQQPDRRKVDETVAEQACKIEQVRRKADADLATIERPGFFVGKLPTSDATET